MSEDIEIINQNTRNEKIKKEVTENRQTSTGVEGLLGAKRPPWAPGGPSRGRLERQEARRLERQEARPEVS